MEASDKIVAPPYFAFKTLTNMLAQMEEHGPPNRVDRSFLTGMSGAGQTQFIHGLKSLGLIDKDANVQPQLSDLVARPDDRPALIGQMVRDRYPEAVELGKGNATTGELLEVFKNSYAVQGDTARKAISFYLAAAKYAGDVQLSPNFKTPSNRSGAGSGTRRRRVNTAADNGADDERADPPKTGPSDGLHPAVLTLVQALPTFDADEPKPVFASADRAAWFAYATATFNLIYALPEGDAGDSS